MSRNFLAVFAAALVPWLVFLPWAPPAFLHAAVLSDDVFAVQVLTSLPSIDVNAPNEVLKGMCYSCRSSSCVYTTMHGRRRVQDGQSALHVAVTRGILSLVDALVSAAKIDVNVADSVRSMHQSTYQPLLLTWWCRPCRRVKSRFLLLQPPG